MCSGNRKIRYGASLLEVLIATSILLVSVAALSTQASVGIRAANRSRLRGLAIVICKSVLDEQIASGQLCTRSPSPAVGFREWMVQTSLEPLGDQRSSLTHSGQEQLRLVSVTAWQAGRNEVLSKTTLSMIVRMPKGSPDVGNNAGGM